MNDLNGTIQYQVYLYSNMNGSARLSDMDCVMIANAMDVIS